MKRFNLIPFLISKELGAIKVLIRLDYIKKHAYLVTCESKSWQKSRQKSDIDFKNWDITVLQPQNQYIV